MKIIWRTTKSDKNVFEFWQTVDFSWRLLKSGDVKWIISQEKRVLRGILWKIARSFYPENRMVGRYSQKMEPPVPRPFITISILIGKPYFISFIQFISDHTIPYKMQPFRYLKSSLHTTRSQGNISPENTYAYFCMAGFVYMCSRFNRLHRKCMK